MKERIKRSRDKMKKALLKKKELERLAKKVKEEAQE